MIMAKHSQPATKDDIDDLAKLVKDNVDDLAKIIGDLASSVSYQFERVNSRLDSVELGQIRIERKLDGTINQVDDHESRLRTLEKQET